MPRVDDSSNVRDIPPYLHHVVGEPFFETDNSVQDIYSSFRKRRNDWLRRYTSQQTELRHALPDLGESIGDGLFLHLPVFNSLELRLGVQTFNDNTYHHLQIIGYTFFATRKRRKDSDTLCRTESLAQIANSQ